MEWLAFQMPSHVGTGCAWHQSCFATGTTSAPDFLTATA